MKDTRVTLAAGIGLLVASALLAPSAAQAQAIQEGVMVGGKVALNLSRARGDDVFVDGDVVEFSMGAAFSVGGLVTFDSHPNVTIQIEGLYSLKNVDVDLEPDETGGNGEVATRFFEIPVLAKLHGERGRDATPFVLVGGTLSFLTGAELRVSSGDFTLVEDITSDLDSFDIGFTFGGGIDIEQDWGRITVDARYNLALDSLSDEGNVKLDAFSVGAGVIF